MGIVGVCVDGCHVRDWNEEPVVTHLDSGSDLTLLSEAVLAHLKKAPCIHSVKGFRLKGVTGEVLGVAWNPYSWLDKPSLRARAEAVKMATLIDKLSLDWEKMKPPLSQEEEDELLGPKMAEVPKSKMLPFPDLAARLDIPLEAPLEIQLRVKELIRKHQDAFSFLDKLGNPTVEVKINTVLGAHPISLPMYRTSSQKREVIDAQIDKWLEQKVIEPLKSPWATPVIIVYQNGKPWFCINYHKLNSVTVLDEFPIP